MAGYLTRVRLIRGDRGALRGGGGRLIHSGGGVEGHRAPSSSLGKLAGGGVGGASKQQSSL